MTGSLKDIAVREAIAAGFDIVRVASLADVGLQLGQGLRAFLAADCHGDMAWLAENADRRSHPNNMWPEARSVIMLGMSYAPDGDPLKVLSERWRGAISVYAKGQDYHDVIKPRLKQVARVLHRVGGEDVKVFVDTAPLMEKPIAALAGVGWQGKHSNLVSREYGSWLFLGAILTTAHLERDEPEISHCGSCRRCLDICPTSAFPAPYRLDARRCISYLTIEHKGSIDRGLRPLMGNRIFGCDDCLAVCPWNKFAEIARETRFRVREATDNPALVELLQVDDAAFRRRFAGTPVKRIGRDRFVRNVLVASGNSGEAGLIPYIEALLDDGSALVRGTAVWALGRLCSGARLLELAMAHRASEADTSVHMEWEAELQE